MTPGQTSVFQPLRALFSTGTLTGLSDGQLLDASSPGKAKAPRLPSRPWWTATDRWFPTSATVFSATPMVPEDAFQAAFLVLARKAGTIGRKDLLGNWLYGVAYRTALKARTRAARRRRHERRSAEMTREAFTPDPDTHELRAVLHEEIRRLPEKYRSRSCSATSRA